jgi:hypothetical protein
LVCWSQTARWSTPRLREAHMDRAQMKLTQFMEYR